ncbi:ribosomal L7Ae/L30e/S12e/Gadd45 family protein [Lachnospiraceae bacterium OttesenSCG-928-D06]|nr:ribosomal L7Ae/L30e/S12e/Gadd45 family protein [Lachnospiraceae bacterium OttesenSCG-928-D06]
MKQNKVLSLLGLAAKGRNLVSGEFKTKSAVIDGSAMLVILASDASDNTKKLFTNKCSYYEIPIIQYGTKETLGHAIGKAERSSLALCDQGLAKAVLKQLEASAEWR